MSRTYRKRSITEEESLEKYVSKHLARVRERRRWEYYMTEGGRRAYEKAMADYETEYYKWLHTPYIHRCNSWFLPKQPTEYEFNNLRITYKEYDHDEEVDYATKEYKKYKRDGRFYESNMNRSYKKYCATELRCKNRHLASKIIKDDDSWEQKPYPDTYLGKTHIWDYF